LFTDGNIIAVKGEDKQQENFPLPVAGILNNLIYYQNNNVM